MGNRCIVVFVKCPEKGKVKSRLSSQLDGELVVTLYESFVVDLLATLEKTGIPYRIAFSPAEGEREIVRRFGCRNVIPQIGADLGERMKNAFDGCFAEGFDEVVLVGSDVPDLPGQVFAESFAVLEIGGAVIVPTLDGGYCLIGFRRDSFVPGIFEGIAWSTERVCADTLERLERAGIGVCKLPQWRDVDTPEDLRDLFLRHLTSPFARSRTMACLRAVYPATSGKD